MPRKSVAKSSKGDTPKLVNRTIAIKVAEVLEGGTKSEFYADLRDSLDLARRAANKAVTECVRQDPDIMTTGEKPSYTYKAFGYHIYHAVNSEFPGAAVVAGNICKSVEKKYQDERWQVSKGLKSICNYRSMPWPLLKSAKLDVRDEGEFISVKIKLLGGAWKVRLAGGERTRRKVKGIRRALESGKICDSKIWVDHRHTAIIGLSVGLPPEENRGSRGTLKVSTARDSLIVATKEQSPVPFVITGDQIVGWIKERDRKYQRLRQDRKSGTSRQRLNAKLRQVGDKWRRRMDSFTHDVSAKIIAHAKRRKVERIELDMTIISFAPKFPWYELKTKIAYKAADAGIELVETTQSIKEPDVSRPHVYFKYDPSTDRIKIGMTKLSTGGRHKGLHADVSSDELVIIAIDNQTKTKVKKRETHYHALFSEHKIPGKQEWFAAEPIIHWLRDVDWVGNAGNMTQIVQVLPAQLLGQDYSHLQGERDCAADLIAAERSREADKCTRYTGLSQTAV